MMPKTNLNFPNCFSERTQGDSLYNLKKLSIWPINIANCGPFWYEWALDTILNQSYKSSTVYAYVVVTVEPGSLNQSSESSRNEDKSNVHKIQSNNEAPKNFEIECSGVQYLNKSCYSSTHQNEQNLKSWLKVVSTTHTPECVKSVYLIEDKLPFN